MRLRPPAIIVLIVLALLVCSHSARGITINGRCYPQPVFLGLNDGQSPRASQANIGWVRTGVYWRDIQTGPTTWNWTPPDGIVNYYYNSGVKILWILSGAPVWAGSNSTGTVPVDIGLWQAFVQQMAARYAGKIAAYEIWNEPDLTNNGGTGVGWDGPLYSLPAYGDYVRVAAQAIRANAPGTLVVAPAMSSCTARSGDVWRSLENYQMTGGTASQYIDVVSFHANANPNSPGTPQWVWTNDILNQMTSIRNNNPSDLNKPVWVTEFGWPSGKVGEQYQANDIQYIMQQLTRYFCELCYPSYCDYNYFPKYSVGFIYHGIDGSGDTQGIFRSNGTPKLVVTSYTTSLPRVGVQPPASGSYTAPWTAASISCVGRTCTFTSGYPDQSTGGLHELFDWDFGDGTSGTSHTTTHTYSGPGTFFVFHGAMWGIQLWTDARILRVP